MAPPSDMFDLFEALFNTIPLILLATDERGVITLARGQYLCILGMMPSDALGSRLGDLFSEAPEVSEMEKDALAGEAVIRTVQTANCYWELNIRPRFQGDRVIGLAALAVDVSDRVQTQQELREAVAAAEQASCAKSEFLARMSHEIRTPMNAILGMTELLLRTSLGSEQREIATTVRCSGEALLGIISDVLDFSKIEAGRLEIERAPLCLRRIAEDALAIVAQAARDKGLALTSSVGDGVPAWVEGDAVRLRQVLLNLLANAVKFTAEGSVTLELCLKEAGVAFVVKDTGIGIDEHAQARLFQPFMQADASTTRRYGGTGMGLVISRRLVELMGGHLQLRSAPGQGTAISFALPLSAIAPPPEAAAPAAAEGELTGTHVLVADDNPVNRSLLQKMLTKLGFTPYLVENGREALEAARRGSYDLVIMDCEMPEMDGYTATRLLREAGYRLPVLALTANVVTGARERCLAAGMDDYLTKPVTMARLEAALRSHLSPPPAG